MRHLGTGLVRRIGRRGAFLLFLALLDAAFAFSLTQAPMTGLLLPADAWAGLWAAAGAMCAGCAFAAKDRLAFGGAAAIKASWAAVNFDLWLNHRLPDGWLGGAIWAAFALTVLIVASWPEPPRKVKLPRA